MLSPMITRSGAARFLISLPGLPAPPALPALPAPPALTGGARV